MFLCQPVQFYCIVFSQPIGQFTGLEKTQSRYACCNCSQVLPSLLAALTGTDQPRIGDAVADKVHRRERRVEPSVGLPKRTSQCVACLDCPVHLAERRLDGLKQVRILDGIDLDRAVLVVMQHLVPATYLVVVKVQRVTFFKRELFHLLGVDDTQLDEVLDRRSYIRTAPRSTCRKVRLRDALQYRTVKVCTTPLEGLRCFRQLAAQVLGIGIEGLVCFRATLERYIVFPTVRLNDTIHLVRPVISPAVQVLVQFMQRIKIREYSIHSRLGFRIKPLVLLPCSV